MTLTKQVGLGCAVVMLCAGLPATSVAANPFRGAGERLRDAFRRAPAEAIPLSTDDIRAGLLEALRVGTERVVARVGAEDGFNADPDIHIPLPEQFAQVQAALRKVGAAGLADDLELRLNRAAETAAPEAKELFWTAISEMTIEDIEQIYKGPDDAATRYFQTKMTPALLERMRPVVERGLADAGAVQAYDRMMGRYERLPFVPDVKGELTDYALEETLDGLFFQLAKEEAAIRQDPKKRTTDLLQRVFGAAS